MKKLSFIIFIFLILSCGRKSIIEERNGKLSINFGNITGTLESIYIDRCEGMETLKESRFEKIGEFSEWFGSGDKYRVEFGKENLRITLDLYITGDGKVILRPAFQGDGPLRGMFIGFSFPESDFDRAFIDGLQSWSPVYVAPVSRFPLELQAHTRMDEFYDLFLTDPRISWWFTSLISNNSSLTAGALSFDMWKSRFFIWKEKGAIYLYLYSGNTKNCREVKEGDFEWYYLKEDSDFWTGLKRYAELLEIQYPPPSEPFNPVGWNSWNTFFDEVTLSDILQNAEFIKENLPALGVNNIQIDDGWEVRWGEWEVNDRFGGSFENITAPIVNMGFKPGIWIAPFLADAESRVFRFHPSWFLKDDEGEYITLPIPPGRKVYIFDLSHPSAVAWIEENILKLLQAGFKYLKLDFLFAGVVEGKFFYPDASPIQNYRAIMDKIFELAQKHSTYLLACGAPFLPSAGVVHGIRTGGDIAQKSMRYSWGFIYNELRNHLLRMPFFSLIRGDPDTLLLRNIALDEGKTFALAILISGGIFALGDDLPLLSEDKVEFLKALPSLPFYPPEKSARFECSECFSFNAQGFPSISLDFQGVYDYLPFKWEREDYIAIINWLNEEISLKGIRGVDVFTDNYLNPVTVSPRSSVLIKRH